MCQGFCEQFTLPQLQDSSFSLFFFYNTKEIKSKKHTSSLYSMLAGLLVYLMHVTFGKHVITASTSLTNQHFICI